MDTEISQNSHNNFSCEKCNYYAKRKSDLNKHYKSKKHNDTFNTAKDTIYECDCGKKYKYHSGYYRHKKKCDFLQEKNNNSIICVQDGEDELNYKEMFLTMVKENQELRSQVTELIPKVGNNNTVNQKFNINVFLNDKCKDALNMNDFIKSIEISIDQLDFTKKNGLAAGLSNAIMENMKRLSLEERPLHCTDVKRETLYIKENDKWSKDKDKEKIKLAIKNASNKNYGALHKWKQENPDFLEDELKQDFFTHVISEIGKPMSKVDEKIIKNLCKETYIKDENN